MSCPPAFITFTGADDGVAEIDFPELESLAADFPVEFGILFSPLQTGSPRYPKATWVTALVEFANRRRTLDLSAHICGGYSRELIATGTIHALAPVFAEGAFRRIQVNTGDPRVIQALPSIRAFADNFNMTVIIQTRDPEVFPAPGMAQWLYDKSGGRGELPARWPSEPHPSAQNVGFAGGLRPENVAQAVAQISSGCKARYWIDMETGVRDEQDRFSLARCTAVCEAVYGGGPPL
jgi:phosphoribosylanthranilate isomerase